MFDIFIAEAPAFSADCESNIMPALVACTTRILRPERLDRVAALYANRHFRASLPCGSRIVAANRS